MKQRYDVLARAVVAAACGLAAAPAWAQDAPPQDRPAQATPALQAEAGAHMQSLTPEQRRALPREMQAMTPEQRAQAHAQTMSLSPEEREQETRARIRQLEKVTVTGSLLPRAQVEKFAPVLTLTSEGIERLGFTDLASALRATTLATGGLREGSPIGSGNTQTARSINLFGLGANYTKVLVNGHPLANFPLAANTGDGGMLADLSNIPMAMVERVEILPGSQSAIYGADAVAGVVNIILKQDVEGVTVSLRGNVYTGGGGASERLQVVGGRRLGEATGLTYAFQASHADPLLGIDRDLTAPSAWNDDALAFNNATGAYYDPGVDGCAQMGTLFGGTTRYHAIDGEIYCASPVMRSTMATFAPAREALNGYLALTHDFSDRLGAYVDVGYTVGKASPGTAPSWFYQTVAEAGTGERYTVSRNFALEEIGGFDAASQHNRTHQYDITAGLRGWIGAGAWGYDAYYSRSAYALKQRKLTPLTAQRNAFLHRRFGNLSQVFVPLTPEEYAGFSTQLTRKADTATQQLSARLHNTDLFALPGGAAGFGMVVEVGDESWTDTPDAVYRAGASTDGSQQASDGGRDRYGVAAQLDLPLLSRLTVTAAARYDRFEYLGLDKGKATWKAGFEFRPLDALLLRGGMGTAFRAADMSYLFLGESRGNSNTYDMYLCDRLGVPRTHASCRYVMANVNVGNPDLEPVTSTSKSVGVVWSPTARLSFNVDYLDIDIDNEVRALSMDNILFDEAACRQGQASVYLPSCEDALARVVRGADGRIAGVSRGYFNVSKKQMKMLMAGADLNLSTGGHGDFRFSLGYSRTLDFLAQNDAVSPVVDVLDDPRGQTAFFRNVFNGSASWDKGPLGLTLFGVRYGETPNFALLSGGWNSTQWGTPGLDAPWILWNASVQYRLPADITVAFTVNNLTDEMPASEGWTSYPYFNANVYNAHGRQLGFEISKSF